jgi:hypothetical protein
MLLDTTEKGLSNRRSVIEPSRPPESIVSIAPVVFRESFRTDFSALMPSFLGYSMKRLVRGPLGCNECEQSGTADLEGVLPNFMVLHGRFNCTK